MAEVLEEVVLAVGVKAVEGPAAVEKVEAALAEGVKVAWLVGESTGMAAEEGVEMAVEG